jgi:glycosyltransferase involved in cell wall biosynthesis
MHILFVHQNYPAQFGHIASYLVKNHGIRCTFVSQQPPGHADGIEKIQYHLQGGATQQTHYCSRTSENAIWHSHAIYEALRARPDVKPDLVVGHSGFLTTTFLSELYHCPVVNYFEYYYWTSGSDMDFRPDFPCTDINRLRARVRNAVLLMDLDNCRLGYSPTRWQRDRLPKEYHDKVRVIFDGIDTQIWHPRPGFPRRIGNWNVPDGMKVVTYVARGMESLRGFDIFMKMAKILGERRKDVTFVVVGQDRVVYGGDSDIIGNRTFKEWVLAQDQYDLSRLVFTGLLPVNTLAELFAVTDVHVYLTVPFVLSWSLMDALACGATVVASDTAPVREMIEHGQNGLLVDFFDVEGLAGVVSKVLDTPQEFKHLGQAGSQMIQERYSLEVCLPQMLNLYQEAAGESSGRLLESRS